LFICSGRFKVALAIIFPQEKEVRFRHLDLNVAIKLSTSDMIYSLISELLRKNSTLSSRSSLAGLFKNWIICFKYSESSDISFSFIINLFFRANCNFSFSGFNISASVKTTLSFSCGLPINVLKFLFIDKSWRRSAESKSWSITLKTISFSPKGPKSCFRSVNPILGPSVRRMGVVPISTLVGNEVASF